MIRTLFSPYEGSGPYLEFKAPYLELNQPIFRLGWGGTAFFNQSNHLFLMARTLKMGPKVLVSKSVKSTHLSAKVRISVRNLPLKVIFHHFWVFANFANFLNYDDFSAIRGRRSSAVKNDIPP